LGGRRRGWVLWADWMGRSRLEGPYSLRSAKGGDGVDGQHGVGWMVKSRGRRYDARIDDDGFTQITLRSNRFAIATRPPTVPRLSARESRRVTLRPASSVALATSPKLTGGHGVARGLDQIDGCAFTPCCAGQVSWSHGVRGGMRRRGDAVTAMGRRSGGWWR
jgi:hypothetical protein